MKRLLSLSLILALLFIIAACTIIDTIDAIDISLDLKERTILTITDDLDANITAGETKFDLTVNLTGTNYLTTPPILRINGINIDHQEFDIIDNILTYSFYATKFLGPNEVMPTLVKLNPVDGNFTSDVLSTIDAPFNITLNHKNDLYSNDFGFFTPRDNGLRWHYKLFIKFDDLIDAYRVVYADPISAGIEHLDLPPYDYVIAAYHHNTLINADDTLKSLFEGDAYGMPVLFDQSLSSYEEGDLGMRLYKANPTDADFSKLLDETYLLPTPVRQNYNFLGWFDGENIIETFSPYLAKDHINIKTLTALWGSYTTDALDSYLNTIIPAYTNKNIHLPVSFSGYAITWESSHPEIIDSSGKFNTSFGPTSVTLTAHITADDTTLIRTYSIDVLHKKPLSLGIASSYIYRNYDAVNDAFFETLDIINTAFITADSQGDLFGSAVLHNIETYIMPKSKIHGNWVIFSVAPESKWSDIVLSNTRMHHFADNIVLMINQYGFDGVDIDWETPKPSEKEQYTQLMAIVYQKVKDNNPNHLVTTAITGGQWQPPNYDLINSNQYIDYINVMTYSMSSNAGSYQNPLYRQTIFHHPEFLVGRSVSTASIDESVDIFNGYGVNNSKLIFGVAFYGVRQVRTFNSSTNTWSAWSSGGSVFYNIIISNYLNNSDYIKAYDNTAGVPYMIKTDGTEFISYDNPKSIRDKGTYILDNDLGGMMFWEYGTDTTGTLLQALKDGLNK